MNSSPLEKRKRRIPAKIPKDEKKEESPRHFSSIAVKTFSKAAKPSIKFSSASPVPVRMNNSSLFTDSSVKPLTSKIGAKINDECSTEPRPSSISPPKSIKRTQSMSKIGNVHQTTKVSNLPKPIYPRQSTGDKPIRPRAITDNLDRLLSRSPSVPNESPRLLSRSPSVPNESPRPLSRSPSVPNESPLSRSAPPTPSPLTKHLLSPTKALPLSPSNSTSSLGSILSQDSYSFEIARLSSPTGLARSSSCGTMLPSQRIKSFMARSEYLYGKATGVIKPSRQKVKPGGMKPLKEKVERIDNSLEPHLKYGIGFSEGLKKSRSVVSGRFGYGLRKSPSGFSEVDSVCSVRSESLSLSCQKVQKQNEKLQNCLTISQDRAIQKISILKETTNSAVHSKRELVCSLEEKDERISSLKDQLANISAVQGGFSDTESVASEMGDAYTDDIRNKNFKLKEKVKRLEDVLTKCKDTIRNGIDTTSTLTKDNETLAALVEKLQFEADEAAASRTSSKSEHYQTALVDVTLDNNANTNNDQERVYYQQQVSELQCQLKESQMFVEQLQRLSKEKKEVKAVLQKEGSLKAVTDAGRRVEEFERKKLEYELETSQEKVKELEDQVEQFKITLQDRDVHKVMAVQDAREESGQQIALLNNKLSAMKDELTQAEEMIVQLRGSDNTAEELMEEMNGIRQEMDRLNNENSELQSEVSSLQQSLLEANREVERGAEARQMLTADCGRLSSELRLTKEEIVREKDEWNKQLDDRHNSSLTDREQLEEQHRSQIKAFKTKIKELQSTIYSGIGKLTEQKEETDSEIADLTRHVFESNSDNAQLTNELSNVQEELKKANTSATLVQHQLADKVEELAELQATLDGLREAVDTMGHHEVELQKHIDTLASEKAELQNTLLNREEVVDRLKINLEELQLQLATSSEELAVLEQDRDSARRGLEQANEEQELKFSQLNQALDCSVKERDTAHSKNEELLSTISSNVDGADALTENNTLLQSQVEQLRVESQALQDKCNSVNTERMRIEQESKELRHALDTLEKVIEDTKHKHKLKLEECSSKLEALASQKREVTKEKEGLYKDNVAISQNLAAVVNQRDALSVKLEKLTTVHYNLQSVVKSKDEKLAEQAAQAAASFSSIQEESQALQAENRRLLKEMSTLEHQRDTLKDKNLEYDKQRQLVEERLQNQENDEESRMSELTQTLSQLQEERDAQRNTIKELETDLEIKVKGLTKQNNEKDVVISDLETNIGTLKSDIDSSRVMNEMLSKERDGLRKDKSEWESKIAVVGQRAQDLQNEMDVLQGENKDLNEKLSEAVKRNDKAGKGIAKAKDLITELRVHNKELQGKLSEREQQCQGFSQQIEGLKEIHQKKLETLAQEHHQSIEEIQQNFFTKLEQSAEAENRLKLEQKRSAGVIEGLTSETKELENIVSKHVAEKKELAKIMKSNMREKEGLVNEVNQLKGQVASLASQLEENKREHDNDLALTEVSAEKDRKISTLSNEIKSLQNETESLRISMRDIELVLDEFSGQLASFEQHLDKDRSPEDPNKIDTVTDTSLRMKTLFAKYIFVAVELKKDIKTVTQGKDQLKTKLIELKRKADARIGELKNENEVHKTSSEELKTSSTRAIEELRSRLDAVINNENTVMKSKEDEVHILQKINKDLSSTLKDVRQSNEEMKFKIDGLTMQVSIQANGVESLKEKLALSVKKEQGREAKLGALSDERQKASKANSVLEEQLLELGNKTTSVECQLSEVLKSLEHAKEENLCLNRVKEENEALTEKGADLWDQLSVLEGEKVKWTEERGRLKEESKRRESEIRSLQESSIVNLLKDEISNKDEMMRRKEEELGQRMAALKQLDNSLAGKGKEIKEMKERFEEHKEEMTFTIEGYQEKMRDEQGNKKHREEKLLALEEGQRVSQEKMVALREELQSTIELKKQLEGELATTQAALQSASKNSAGMSELQTALAVSEERCKELREEVQVVKSEVPQLRSQLEVLQNEIQTKKDELVYENSEREKMSELCNKFQQKIKEIEHQLDERENDLKSLQAENSHLTTHTKNLETCFRSLKEEKNKILESIGQLEADFRHREQAKTKEHSQTLEELQSSMDEKVRKASEDSEQKLSSENSLNGQIKRLEEDVKVAKSERSEAHMKHTVAISEYSTKLLSSEKRIQALQVDLGDKTKEVGTLKSTCLTTQAHEEIVFNLEMAYHMNLEEQKSQYEGQIKALHQSDNMTVLNVNDLMDNVPMVEMQEVTKVHCAVPGEGTPGYNDALNTAESKVSELQSQMSSIIKQHKLALDSTQSEAQFSARKEYDLKLQQWREMMEQKQNEETHTLMEESSKDRAFLLKEIDVLQSRSVCANCSGGGNQAHLGYNKPALDDSKGRISVDQSDAESDVFLVDTEFEYLKQILYKYLKGDHTMQLLKVIMAICRYTDMEKAILLDKNKK